MSGEPNNPRSGSPPVLHPTPEGPAPAGPAGGRGLGAPEVTAASAFAAGIPIEGSLREKGALHLHYLAAAPQASGRLVLGAASASFALTYRRGVVEHAASNREKDDLAEFLVRRGLLAPEAAADARKLAPTFGGDVLGALVELRLLDPAARFQELKEHGAAVVWRALACEEGGWRWEPGVPPPPFGFPVGSRWGLLTEAVRRLEPSDVRRRLGVRGALAVARTGGRLDLPDLLLNPQEARAAAHLDGVRSVDELAEAHPGDADALRRVVFLLAETELVTFGAPRIGSSAPPPPPPPRPAAKAAPAAPAAPAAAVPPARPPPQAAAPTPPPRPAGPRPAPAAPAKSAPAPAAAPTLEVLRATAERVRAADHFQVLGVSREADVARIKAAYFQLARSFHPDAAKEGEGPEARSLRAEIFARVAAAWAALETDAGRAAYLEELKNGSPTQDIGSIYRAEQAFEKVAPLVASRAYAEALARVDEAIGLFADEPEYHMWKAWLEFLLAPEAQRKAQRLHAERAIEAALRESPRCAAGWLFLGRMAKTTGDLSAAERHLKKGLEQVHDPELERELRFLKR